MDTIIEAFGLTQLVQVDDHYFLRDGIGSGPVLRMFGTPVVVGAFGAWTPIAAEQTPGGYQIVWKNGAADEYDAWNVGGGGNYLSHVFNVVPGSSPELLALESVFHQDLNGDGILSAAITALSTTATTVSFVATDVDSGSLSLASPFDAAFGTPTVANGAATTLTPGAQAVALRGTLKVSDGTNAFDVLGLYLGTGGNDVGIAPTAPSNAMYGFGGADTLKGGVGADTISGGDGNDTIVGAQNDTLLDGGADTDRLRVEVNFTSTGDAQIAGIERILLDQAVGGHAQHGQSKRILQDHRIVGR